MFKILKTKFLRVTRNKLVYAWILGVFCGIYFRLSITDQKETLISLNKSYNESCLYSRCTKEPIPTVLGQLETALYLRDHPGLSFVRFGDGDVELMMKKEVPYQKPSEQLSNAMIRSFTSNFSNLMVGLPDIFGGCGEIHPAGMRYWYRRPRYEQFLRKYIDMNRLYLTGWISDMHVHTNGTFCIDKPRAYNALRQVWKDKDLILVIGDNKQVYDYDIYDTARSRTIILAPRYQAWSAYETLKQRLLNENASSLFILTCGPVGKVLVYDLVLSGRVALDLGHLAKDYDAYYGKKNLTGFFMD